MSIQELKNNIACPPEEITLVFDADKSLEDLENIYRQNLSMCAIIESANIEKEEFIVSLSNSAHAILPFKDCLIQSFMSMTYLNPRGEKLLSHYSQSIIGKKVSVNITHFSENEIRVTRIPSLEKAYKTILKECENPNSIFQCLVLSCSRRSAFVDMGGGIVGIVPMQELSLVRYSNVSNWITAGDTFYAMLESLDSDMHFSLSRKAYSLCEINPKIFEVGDLLTVAIGDRVPTHDGYFVELTPGIAGIMDSKRMLFEGEVTLGIIRKIIPDTHVPCGYRFRLDEA